MSRAEAIQAEGNKCYPIECPEGFDEQCRAEVTFWKDGTVSLDLYTDAGSDGMVIETLEQSAHKFEVHLRGRYT